MNKKTFKIISVSVLGIMALITLFTKKPEVNETITKDTYTLRSYRNSVALYKNEELLQIYDDIVLNTLPESDIYQLSKGIVIENLAQISSILEDYDG